MFPTDTGCTVRSKSVVLGPSAFAEVVAQRRGPPLVLNAAP